jgi:hypothetical protein
MTSPVESGSRVQQHGDHQAAANGARVAKPAGVGPGHSQEITNGHLKRESAVNVAPIETQMRVLQTKLHIGSDFRQGPSFDSALNNLGRKLVQPIGHTPINEQIDARIAQLKSQRAACNDRFACLRIDHDIERLGDLKKLQELTSTRNSVCEKSQNLSTKMSDLKRKLSDSRLPQAEWLKTAGEYRSRAAELDRCSMQLKGVQEGAQAAASADIMDSILGRFGNPPQPVTASFLRLQLNVMQNEFLAYAQSSGGAKNGAPYLQSMRNNLHTALSNLCAWGLMNHSSNVIPEIFKTIDGLGTNKAGPRR